MIGYGNLPGSEPIENRLQAPSDAIGRDFQPFWEFVVVDKPIDCRPAQACEITDCPNADQLQVGRLGKISFGLFASQCCLRALRPLCEEHRRSSCSRHTL